jgi:hypothetical protein
VAAVAAVLAATLMASSDAHAAYTQCPRIGSDFGCQFLIIETDGGPTVSQDPSEASYEGDEDALVGVANNTSRPMSTIRLASPGSTMFGFDGDGLCNPGARGPVPTTGGSDGKGCEPQPFAPAGTSCNPSTAQTSNCSFAPPLGEPPNTIEPGATPVTKAWPNGDIQNGYEGPGNWFSGVSTDRSAGVVDFSPALQPGQSTYFSVESPQLGRFIVGTPTATAATLSASDGSSGATLQVQPGTSVTNMATISGQSAGAGGTVTYAVFTDNQCRNAAISISPQHVPVVNGVAQPSSASTLPPGTYYFTASYSGDAANSSSQTACGSDVLVVQPPPPPPPLQPPPPPPPDVTPLGTGTSGCDRCLAPFIVYFATRAVHSASTNIGVIVGISTITGLPQHVTVTVRCVKGCSRRYRRRLTRTNRQALSWRINLAVSRKTVLSVTAVSNGNTRTESFHFVRTRLGLLPRKVS